MVTFAKPTKFGITNTCPRRSEIDCTPVLKLPHTLDFKFQFDSKTDADKPPVEYSVALNDLSEVLTPKEGHIDYAHITETSLHLLMGDIYSGLRRNGRRIEIEGNIKVRVYD